ncbi:hypothetical protein BJX68DRAFT_273974 [Aspergillus pseudodeflectus]|uniref:Xylanolytic transcriptional activator regulatory domain-containing protein n=1 Tax=Aspergillus pseudodeflectus TaxID=176178 RepID=A0ABR4LBY5_9EURO
MLKHRFKDSRCTYEYQRKKPGLKGGVVDTLTRRVEALEHAMYSSSSSHVTDARRADTVSEELRSLREILSAFTRDIAQLTRYPTQSPETMLHAHVRDHDPALERPEKRIHLDSGQGPSLDAAIDRGSSIRTLLESPEVVAALLDAYFDIIHPWIPILHEVRFRSRIAHNPEREACGIILHAILVAALRFVDLKGLIGLGPIPQDEVARSRDYVVLNAMADLRLENLQALIIVAFTDIGQGETSKAWPTIGSLTRTVQYLHLSVEDTDKDQRPGLLPNLPSLPAPDTWVEEEERRRVFWSVFLLDRWNVSLTADDICRRLPIDGGLWARNQPAVTPYLGIWDHSAAKIGHTITFLPSKYEAPSEKATEAGAAKRLNDARSSPPGQTTCMGSPEMTRIGAFAYYIESVESLSRINAYFVQQKIDFADREDVLSWLTRFKELDLRLVHWKMFLPTKWKDPNVNPNPATTAMDPNMTLAHITHNTSSILLHQRIAYPRRAIRHLRLPNACSADTCFVAATETANITTKYLERAPVARVLAPHFAICVFVSARVLLVHSLYYKVDLVPEFGTLVNALDIMDKRWIGRPGGHLSGDSAELSRIFGETRARRVRPAKRCREGDWVSNQGLPSAQGTQGTPAALLSPATPLSFSAAGGGGDMQPGPPPVVPRSNVLGTEEGAVDELSAISHGLLDESFLEMNRIINFDDFMFMTNVEELGRAGPEWLPGLDDSHEANAES